MADAGALLLRRGRARSRARAVGGGDAGFSEGGGGARLQSGSGRYYGREAERRAVGDVGSFGVRTLRRIARGADFQARLAVCGGDGVRLFGAECGYDLDDAQLTILQYARFYKGIYELSPAERPGEDVIADDKGLDAWYENFAREIARKAGVKGDKRFSLLGEEKQFKVPEWKGA